MIELVINGDPPETPQEMVLAIEAVTKAITPGPAQGIMVLVTAAMHVHRACRKPGTFASKEDEVKHFAEMIGHALGCVEDWWPEAGEDEPANQNRPGRVQ
jgi:hypothetical protein